MLCCVLPCGFEPRTYMCCLSFFFFFLRLLLLVLAGSSPLLFLFCCDVVGCRLFLARGRGCAVDGAWACSHACMWAAGRGSFFCTGTSCIFVGRLFSFRREKQGRTDFMRRFQFQFQFQSNRNEGETEISRGGTKRHTNEVP